MLPLHALCSVFALILATARVSEGGSCWTAAEDSDRCGELFLRNVSFKKCCATNATIFRGASFMYSERDAKNSKELFFLVFVNPPTKCKRCSNKCSGMKCSVNDRVSCTVRKGRTSRCSCLPDCTNTFESPVCSTEQNTYLSECDLLTESCQTRRTIHIDYYSRCQGSCETVNCPKGRFCVEDQYRLPHCVRNILCTAKCPVKNTDRELCGTNGVTYKNICMLRQVVCLKGKARRVGVAYKGRCRSTANCDNIQCSSRNKCLKDGEKVRCVKCKGYCIGNAFNKYKPVCATDGLTYINWCSLRRAACETGKHIEVVRTGFC